MAAIQELNEVSMENQATTEDPAMTKAIGELDQTGDVIFGESGTKWIIFAS